MICSFYVSLRIARVSLKQVWPSQRVGQGFQIMTSAMLYRDTEALDTSLGNTVSTFISCLANVIGSLLVVMFVTPAVLFAVVPLGILYRQVQVSQFSDSLPYWCNFKSMCIFCLEVGSSHISRSLSSFSTRPDMSILEVPVHLMRGLNCSCIMLPPLVSSNALTLWQCHPSLGISARA